MLGVLGSWLPNWFAAIPGRKEDGLFNSDLASRDQMVIRTFCVACLCLPSACTADLVGKETSFSLYLSKFLAGNPVTKDRFTREKQTEVY